ncbi:hypothetical protein A2U01_0104326, partial [Trifolium medium]|nr:hypothetical protein [Trifolium medium]
NNHQPQHFTTFNYNNHRRSLHDTTLPSPSSISIITAAAATERTERWCKRGQGERPAMTVASAGAAAGEKFGNT